MILVLAAIAGGVWWRVLQRQETAAAAEACAAAAALDPRTVKLRVYNASTREGLARTVASQLTRRGFVVLATANDPLLDLRPVTAGWAEIRYGSAGARQARLVAAHVPGAKLFRDGRGDAVVDVALGPAFKRLSTAAEVAKATAAIDAANAARQTTQGILAAAPSASAVPAGC
ncbi:MAG TPA: LytR C-terminal domain-containing protein [Mycobacteriales bacterium]